MHQEGLSGFFAVVEVPLPHYQIPGQTGAMIPLEKPGQSEMTCTDTCFGEGLSGIFVAVKSRVARHCKWLYANSNLRMMHLAGTVGSESVVEVLG